MFSVTVNEMRVVLTIVKDFTTRYNANNLAKKLGLSSMGVLKILKRLYAQDILFTEHFGNAVYYSFNYDNSYARSYILFLLQKEAVEAAPRVRRWISELQHLQESASTGILFGSVLNSDEHDDVDLLVISSQEQVASLDWKISGMNRINVKKTHPVKQTMNELKHNLKKNDPVILQSIRQGIVLFGYEKFILVMQDVSRSKQS